MYYKDKIIEKIQPGHITNVDEVSLTFDIPVNPTVERTGTSNLAVGYLYTTGNEKSCLTVVLGCQADGQKLSLMVIFKRKISPKETSPIWINVGLWTSFPSALACGRTLASLCLCPPAAQRFHRFPLY